MSELEQPGVIIEPTSFWCPLHLIAFRADWPRGYMPASLALFQEAIRLPEIIDASGGQAAMLDRVMREYGPVCCLLRDEITLRWVGLALAEDQAPYIEALIELQSRTEPS